MTTRSAFSLPSSPEVGVYEVWDGLYQGHSPISDEDWIEVWKVVDAVVSLSASAGDPAVPEGKAIFQWLIEDGPLPDLDMLHPVVNFVAGLVDNEVPVLVHCGAGVNRSGLVTALVVRELSGESGRISAEHVRTRRPGSLINGQFSDYLNSLPSLEDGDETEEEEDELHGFRVSTEGAD